MGQLKDGLYAAVWTHLQAMPKCQTLLTALNHPISGSQAIRNAWSSLKDDGREEGVKKQTGLQSVLAERPDIFFFETTDRGHQLIGLTQGAQALDPSSGIPEIVPMLAEPLPEVDLFSEAAQLQALVDSEDPTVAAQLASLAAALERPSKAARTGKGKGKMVVGGGPHSCAYGGNWNGWCFTDIVWTPELQRKKGEEKAKEVKLVRALYRAMDMHAGKSVTLSQLGSDFKVAELKKDPHFKNWRLLDILKEYENVFEIVPAAGVAGGMTVKLQPGAEAALPDAELAAELVNEAELMLPERIENPKSTRERIQALRIELLYALQRRGGRTAIQELGQEPRVQKVKSELRQQRKLVDWIRVFADNFKILPEKTDGQMVVEIASMDVSDMSMIDKAVSRGEQPDSRQASTARTGKGGEREREQQRSRPQGRSGGGSSSSRSSPSAAYPGVAAYPGYGYGCGYGGPCPGYGPGYGLQPGYPQALPQPGAYPGYPAGQPGYPAGQPPAGYPPPAGYAPPPAGYSAAYPPSGYSAGYPPPASNGAPPPAGYGGGAPPAAPAPAHGGYPPQGYPPQGYPPQGYPPQGHAPQGYAPQGYPPPQGHPQAPASYPYRVA